jgi:serine/threonine-protein kinase
MVMGTAMYVSPEQATGAPVNDASDIYSLGVVAYECLAGHPPFTAREPLAIAFAHKHEPVPALPPDVPHPVSDLVYHMLAKTPDERPASVRVVADRADMLRDSLTVGHSAEPADHLGATRADLLPAAATDFLLGRADLDPERPGGGSRRPARRQRLVTVSTTAVLCALAAAAGLYLTGHIHGQASGNAGSNTAQHLSSPTVTPSHGATPHPRPTPHPSLVVEQPATSPSPTGNPQPVKSAKPTSSPKKSPSASASPSASGSPSPTSSSSVSPSPTPTSSQSH